MQIIIVILRMILTSVKRKINKQFLSQLFLCSKAKFPKT